MSLFTFPNDKCFLVAEIGINHNGMLENAISLIRRVKEAGFDCVKFQMRTIDLVYSKEFLNQKRESPWGTTQRQQKEALEFDFDEYKEINEYCRRKNILWTASVWDVESLGRLLFFDPPYIKIPSPCAVDADLVKACADTGLPLFVSTGGLFSKDIENVVSFIRDHGGDLCCLYHCISSYPTKDEDVNLRAIETLKKAYPDVHVGYSGHELGVVLSLCAAALGAESIERHVTLSREHYGSDQEFSLDPFAFHRLVVNIRKWEKARGTGELVVTQDEMATINKLRTKETLLGDDRWLV